MLELMRAIIDEDEQRLHHGQVHEKSAEHQHDARVLGESLRVIDPELCQRGEKNEQREQELFGLLRARPVEDQRGQPHQERPGRSTP